MKRGKEEKRKRTCSEMQQDGCSKTQQETENRNARNKMGKAQAKELRNWGNEKKIRKS